MGKLNEIQEEVKQSYGDNSFTTRIENDTVVFDSAKDSFTFEDEVNVPSLKVNGESVSAQVQADWNQSDSTKADHIKNRICYENIIDVVGQILQMGDTGQQNFYFNIQANPVIGETYIFGVGPHTFDTIYNGGETSGSMGVTIIIDGYTSGSMNLTWDVNGVSGAPNGETAVLNVNGSRIDLRNKYLSIKQYSIIKIDDKFIPDTIARDSEVLITAGSGNNSIVAKNFTNCHATGNHAISLATNKYSLGNNSVSFGNATTVQNDTLSLTYVSSNTFTSNYDYSKYKGCKCLKVVNGAVEDTIRTISDAVYDENIDKTTFTISGLGSSNAEIYVLRGAIGTNSFSEGWDTIASGNGAHSEGDETISRGSASHSEGRQTIASGNRAHSEGAVTIASGDCSHSEGEDTIASGYCSHTEGLYSKSSGRCSHSQGTGTIAAAGSCIASGEYNVADEFDPNEYPSWTMNTDYAVGDKAKYNGECFICIVAHNSGSSYYNNWDKWTVSQRANYVEIVGNGLSDSSRSNARTLDWSGNEQIAGTLRIGSTSTGGALLKFESNSLKVSFDNGSTWLTVSAS